MIYTRWISAVDYLERIGSARKPLIVTQGLPKILSEDSQKCSLRQDSMVTRKREASVSCKLSIQKRTAPHQRQSSLSPGYEHRTQPEIFA